MEFAMATMIQFKDHPVWKEIQKYAAADQPQSQMAFMIYLELCEDKGWWNVKTHFCDQLSMVFLSGHASRNKPREIILPVSVDTKLSPAEMKKYIDTVKLPEYNIDSVVLAICGGSADTVYYRLTSGLVPPEHPELTEWKKYRHEEVFDLKRHHVSEQTALYINRKQAKQPELEESSRENDT